MPNTAEEKKRSLRRDSIEDLATKAKTVRRHILRMLAEAGSGHPGGSLSVTDLLVCLYFARLNHRPGHPGWEERDRVVLSKGHAVPALYAVLAECGYFPTSELATLRKLGSRLQGHPDVTRTPGLEASTGSLGQGISIAVGMALAGKLDKKGYRVYAFLGDGELQEGEVWEAAMAAAHYRCDNLCAIVDFNGLQIDGRVQDVMNPEPIVGKWEAFGWRAREINGHDYADILEAYDWAVAGEGRPSAIVARTVKGRGVTFMEGKAKWHGVAPSKEECTQALKDLGEE